MRNYGIKSKACHRLQAVPVVFFTLLFINGCVSSYLWKDAHTRDETILSATSDHVAASEKRVSRSDIGRIDGESEMWFHYKADSESKKKFDKGDIFFPEFPEGHCAIALSEDIIKVLENMPEVAVSSLVLNKTWDSREGTLFSRSEATANEKLHLGITLEILKDGDVDSVLHRLRALNQKVTSVRLKIKDSA